MPSPALVFPPVLEGLFLRSLQGQVSPALKERLRREAGVDLDKPLLPAYPVEVWVRAQALTAQTLFPALDVDAAHQRLGERFIEGYGETLVGGAMMAMLRLLGTRRALARMPRAFRSGNNYVELALRERGPTEVDFDFDCMHEHPGFFAGVLRGGARSTGARDVQVSVVSHQGLRCTYRVRWSEG